MKHLLNVILNFLFPEIQIIDEIKRKGFIARRQESARQAMDSQINVDDRGYQQKSLAETATFTNNDSRIEKGKMESSVQLNNIPADKISDKFIDFDAELRGRFVASGKDIQSLVHAFKRPFIMGYNLVHPKSCVLLIGNESRGKVKSIREIALLLKQRKLIRNSDISCMDMSNYPTNAEDAIFLSDLYKSLYDQSDIVVFENIDKINYQCLEIFKHLLQKGEYHLQKRYIMQNNILVESTGVLNTTSISHISANGKFFVFTSTTSEDKVAEVVGNEFIRFMNDIIAFDEFEQTEIREITEIVIRDLVVKAKKHLQMQLCLEEGVIDHISNEFNSSVGVKSLYIYVEEHIYKPLVEYRLHHIVKAEEMASLSYNHGYYIKILDDMHALDIYKKNYDKLALEDVKIELSKIIGLDNVKEYILSLENNFLIQKLRLQKGLKEADISMHMIFTGNPGTGKTTMARLVAKYLKALGVLSAGHLLEVSRSDLVGQYVGQTAMLTTNIIKASLGGILFIDEAYALCRDKNDIFGMEAVDALVKGIEDYRDDLVVILAGYTNEMEEFLDTNSGLKSRFPHKVEFVDYTPDEMYQIAQLTAENKGYRISNECRELLLNEFERKQIKGRNDSGNGRLARNVIEAAILKQSKRIAKDSKQDLELLIIDDFDLNKNKTFNLEEQLASIIGLETVKDFVRTQYNIMRARAKRKQANLKVDTTQSLNMIFTGNPGTGKTTMARIVAKMFCAMGVLKSGHLVEVDKGDLLAEYVGQTAKKTEDVFRTALGGVLFIDEAYAITNDGNSFGQECVDTLVKLIEDYRGEICVILAGYSKEMDEFMKANSGLESRFPIGIEFPDYSAEELFKIGKLMVLNRGFRIADDALPVFEEAIYDLKRHATATSGNGRMVRNYIDEIIRNQSSRIAITEVNADDLTIILPIDIEPQFVPEEAYDLEAELSKVIGLDTVKDYIRSLNARLKVQEQRKKHGLKVNSTQTLHMIFMGNPGTGKTMMARTVANVLYNMGVISSNKLVETDRSGLVAGYVGQTALKTRQVIESALGGVLFIDEAYSLAQGGDNDFGQEAIDILVKMMDDYRECLVVILAGYCDDMRNFLDQNAGLKSRFPNVIEFEDYSVSDLLSIARKMYEEQGYMLTTEADELLSGIFEKGKKQHQFGNGRFVRNIFESSLNMQALRLSQINTPSTAELLTITVDDIKEVQF